MFTFCHDDLSVGESKVLKSPWTTVLGLVCDLHPVIEVLWNWVNFWGIHISLGLRYPHNGVVCWLVWNDIPYLFLSSFGLKSILSDIITGTPAYFLGPFASNALFYTSSCRWCLFYVERCIPWRQQIADICFFFNIILCLLIDESRPLIFIVTESCASITVVLLFFSVYFLFLSYLTVISHDLFFSMVSWINLLSRPVFEAFHHVSPVVLA